ncbi:hypothetical protein Mx9_p04 [Myxococcus phage Mx9]|nr:hypothetical protein Mx9_p04 [Myxococcus phage Mx9]
MTSCALCWTRRWRRGRSPRSSPYSHPLGVGALAGLPLIRAASRWLLS